jgi:preprotein translocase subunit SecB
MAIQSSKIVMTKRCFRTINKLFKKVCMADAQENKNTPAMQVRAQYVKDLSFENPHAPQSLMATNTRPAIDVGVDLKAQKLQEDVFEVVVHVSARANVENNTLFLVEVDYAGIFQLSGIPAEHIERVLLIDAPFIMFPFLRRVISDITRDGGFPPLMLDPIDFNQLYIQNKPKE